MGYSTQRFDLYICVKRLDLQDTELRLQNVRRALDRRVMAEGSLHCVRAQLTAELITIQTVEREILPRGTRGMLQDDNSDKKLVVKELY